MATDKPRFTIILDHDVNDKLESYWRLTGMKNRNVAINFLLNLALDRLDNKPVLDPDEQTVLDAYRKSEPIAKFMVKGALNAGNIYANAHFSHRKASPPLGDDPPEPLAQIDGDTLTYTDDNLGQVIKETRFAPPPDETKHA